MATETAEAMDGVMRPLLPLFKERGFRKRSRTFNRNAEEGVVHVVNFQMGSYQPPGVAEIPNLRRNMYGRFTINLGVYLLDVAMREAGEKFSPKAFIPEYHCHIRTRLGQLLSQHTDVWWKVAQPNERIVLDVSEAMTSAGFPWLEQFESVEQVLMRLEDPKTSVDFLESRTRNLIAMRIRLTRGEFGRAEEDFLAHVKACLKNPPNPRHFGLLDQISKTENFSVDVSSLYKGIHP